MTRFLTHVLLERPAALSVWGLMEETRRFAHPRRPALARLEPPASGAPENTLLLSLDGLGVVVMFKTAPPPADLRDSARLGLAQPEEALEGISVRAHVSVGLVEEPETPAEALRGARTTALIAGVLARLFAAPAVIFAEGFALTEGPEFIQAAREIAGGGAPVRIWIGCDLRRGPKGLSAATRGLSPFLGREMQIEPCALEASSLRRRLTEMALPLVHSGQGFQDGATVSLANGDCFRAQHLVASPLTGEPAVALTLMAPEVLETPERRRA